MTVRATDDDCLSTCRSMEVSGIWIVENTVGMKLPLSCLRRSYAFHACLLDRVDRRCHMNPGQAEAKCVYLVEDLSEITYDLFLRDTRRSAAALTMVAGDTDCCLTRWKHGSKLHDHGLHSRSGRP